MGQAARLVPESFSTSTVRELFSKAVVCYAAWTKIGLVHVNLDRFTCGIHPKIADDCAPLITKRRAKTPLPGTQVASYPGMPNPVPTDRIIDALGRIPRWLWTSRMQVISCTLLLALSLVASAPANGASIPLPLESSFELACRKGFWGLSRAYSLTRRATDRAWNWRTDSDLPQPVRARVQQRRETERQKAWQQWQGSISGYLKEAQDTWLRSLVLREPGKALVKKQGRFVVRKSKVEKTEFYGYLTRWKPKADRWYHHFQLANPLFWLQLPNRVVSKQITGRPYSVSPINGLEHTLLVGPVRTTSKLLTGKTFEPTVLARILWWIGVTLGGDAAYYQALNNKLEDSVQSFHNEYDDLIDHDIRFSHIREALRDPKSGVTREAARRAAFLLLLAHNSYVEYLATEAVTDSAEDRRLRRSVAYEELAPHWNRVIEGGIQALPGYRLNIEPRPLEPEEQDTLFNIQDETFLRQRILRAYVYDDQRELQAIRQSPQASERLDALLADGFHQFLFSLHQQGKLSQGELLSELQLNVEWQLRFAAADVLHLTPLPELIGEEPGILGGPLTLTQVQLNTVRRLVKMTAERPLPTARKARAE